MNLVRRRIVAALGAGAFGQAITLAIQLLSLPLFLAVWSTAEYGVWLMLSALTAYLSMADVGLVTAVGNQMTMATGRGDMAEAKRLFQSALAFMLLVCGVLALVALALVAWAPMDSLDRGDRRLALAALAMGTLLSLFGGLADALFRATGRYASGLVVANVVRLAEWLGWIAGLLLAGSYSAVALGGLLVRVIGSVVLVGLSARGGHGITWGLAEARLGEVRRMLVPALSFMAFPLSNALNFQGMTLLVGHLFGPAALALFNAYRTLTRVAVQLTAMFAHSIWPEVSRLFGQGGPCAVRSVYLRSAWFCAAMALVLSLSLYPPAPWLLRLWTHGAIAFDAPLMELMLVYAAISGLWHVPRVLLLATNLHAGLAAWVLGTAAAALALAWILGRVWGLAGVACALVTMEAVIALACAQLARAVFHRSRAGAAA